MKYASKIIIIIAVVTLVSCNKNTETINNDENKYICLLNEIIVDSVKTVKYEYSNNLLSKEIEYDVNGNISTYKTYEYDYYLTKVNVYKSDTLFEKIYCKNNNEKPVKYTFYKDNKILYYDTLIYSSDKVSYIDYYNIYNRYSTIKYTWKNNNITEQSSYFVSNNEETINQKIEYLLYDNMYSPYTNAGIKNLNYNSVNNVLKERNIKGENIVETNYVYEYNYLGYPTKVTATKSTGEVQVTEYLYIYNKVF